MRLPLGPNRNHQQTAFAGSLNALCTIAGWGTVVSAAQGARPPRQRRHPPQHDPLPGAGHLGRDLCPLPAGVARSPAVLSRNARRQETGQARPGRRNRRPGRHARFLHRLVRRDPERQQLVSGVGHDVCPNGCTSPVPTWQSPPAQPVIGCHSCGCQFGGHRPGHFATPRS